MLFPDVRRWSTIRVAHRTYSVRAQLMGHTVEARVHPNVVEVRYRDLVVQTKPRLRKEDASLRSDRIHANAEGYARIAQQLADQLKAAGWR